jgi:hypothetical protein
MMLVLLLSGVVFGQEPPSAPPVVCCDTAELTAQVKLYLKVQRAMNEGAAVGQMTGPMYGWAPRVQRLNPGTSPTEGAAIARLQTLAQDLKGAGKASFAESFGELSQLMTLLVLRHPGGSLKLREAYCGDRPFLQQDGPLAPPWPDATDCRFRESPTP